MIVHAWGKLRRMMQAIRTAPMIVTLNMVGLIFFVLGLAIAPWEPEFWNKDTTTTKRIINSFHHLQFNRYMFAGIVILALLFLTPKKIFKWARDFSDATGELSALPLGNLIFLGFIMVIYHPLFLPVFIPILICSLMFLISALVPFSSPEGRQYAIRVYDRFGLAAPTLFAAAITLYAVVLFSWISLFLSAHGWALISGTDGAKKDDIGFYIAAFGYEAAKAIPVIDLSDAFGWKAPYSHSGYVAGLVIVVFRIAVLAPIIGFYATYWHRIRKKHKIVPYENETMTDAPIPSDHSDTGIDSIRNSTNGQDF